MNKVYMSFGEKFWPSGSWVRIAYDRRGKYPHYLDFSTQDRSVLCCLITDDFARECEDKSDGEIVEELLSGLKSTFALESIQLREAVVTRWGQDEFSRGSYTSFHKGSSAEDCFNLRKPIDDQMWFIGEHCYAEHIGTAHGALQTGEWAAEQVLRTLHQ